MTKTIDWEKISLGIITYAGEAKSYSMEALNDAKQGKFELAKDKIDLAHKKNAQASSMHFDVIKEEANGKQLDYKILFIHAEDQLLATQTIMILVEEMIEIYKRIT